MIKQYYPNEISVPKQGEIAIFRNKNNGHRYYKASDGRIVKMDDETNGETFNIYESNISSVVNYTEDAIEFLDTDKSGINLITVKFCCVKSVTKPLPGFRGPRGLQGEAGGLLDFADFFALMPGDNAAPVALGGSVDFPQNGPTSGGGITRTGVDTFNLAAVGTYEVNYQVSVDEAGQLVVALNGVEQLPTTSGRATGTSQIVGVMLITTVAINTVLSINNPAGNAAALTITPIAGGTLSASAHLVIKRLA